MKRLIWCLILLLGPFTMAQAQMSEELEYLEQLQDAFDENRRSEMGPKLSAPIIEERETIQPTYQAVLKKGAQVQTPNGKKNWTIAEPIYVNARLQYPGSPYTFLLGKDEEVILSTRSENLSSLERVTELFPTTDPTKNYVDATAFRSVNTSYDIETKLSFHLESSDATYLSRFHSSQEGSATSTRLQAESYFLSFLPLDFGLSLSFQSGSFGDELSNQRTSFSGAYFGPVVKALVYENENSTIEVFGKAEKSLSLSTDDGETQNQFSSNVWSVGADWTTQTFLGRFFLGVAYRVQRFSLKETSNSNLRIPSQKESLTGPSVFLGYRFTINL